MPDEAIQQLIDRMDELCGVEPSKVMLDIYNYEKIHANRVLKDYGRFVSQFELYYDLIVELVKGINYIDKNDWPEYRGTQFILIVHNLKSLYSSFERLLHGFYEDSLIVLRPAYEAFFKLVYISCHPKDPYFPITEKRDGSKAKFNFTNFVKQDLGLEWNGYSIFSMMTHANKYSVLKEAVGIKMDGQKNAITLKFQYDKKMLELGINNISFLLLVYLKTIYELFATDNNYALKKDFLEKAKELIDLRERDFLSHQKTYWPMLIKDIRDIFKLLSSSRKDINWKTEWDKIRK